MWLRFALDDLKRCFTISQNVAVAAPTDSSPTATGWLTTAPPLAVEYAGQGQDEADLRLKIAELLDTDTLLRWSERVLTARTLDEILAE